MQPLYDVSVVLNVHSEDAYLEKTLRSLEEAAGVASRCGATVELVIVQDRPTQAVTRIVDRYGSAAFAAIRSVTVDNGSLGLSRNAGVDIAAGEYISISDGDDLISDNFLIEHLRLCRDFGPSAIGIPQYLVGFDEQNYLVEYFSMATISIMRFLVDHPYTSKVFYWRGLRDHLRFRDTSKRTGYCYEDWHFNAEAVAAGCLFQRVPDTVLFYRRRSAGLLRQSFSLPTQTMPPTRLFAPRKYVRAAVGDMSAATELPKSHFDEAASKASFASKADVAVALDKARRLEPAIPSVEVLVGAEMWSNMRCREEPGMRYFNLCKEIGSASLSDIVLDLAHPPAEGLADLVRGLSRRQGGDKVLLITASPLARSLPCRSISLHSHHEQAGLVDDGIVLFRLLEHLEGAGRLHFMASDAARAFLATYGSVLGHRAVLYREHQSDQDAPIVEHAATIVDLRRKAIRILVKNGPSGGPWAREATRLADALGMICNPPKSISVEFIERNGLHAKMGSASSRWMKPHHKRLKPTPRSRKSLSGKDRSVWHLPRNASRAMRRWIVPK